MYYTSNHDENSWNGSEYEKYGVYAKALAVFANTYTSSVPLIYSGQELPYTQRLSFFDKDQIDWNEKPGLHSFYTLLHSLRKRNPVFAGNSDLSFLQSPDGILAFSRTVGDHIIIVLLNLSRQGINEVLHLSEIEGVFNNIFTNELVNVERRLNIRLERGEFLVLEKVNP